MDEIDAALEVIVSSLTDIRLPTRNLLTITQRQAEWRSETKWQFRLVVISLSAKSGSTQHPADEQRPSQ